MHNSSSILRRGTGAIVRGISLMMTDTESFAFSLGEAVLHRIEADVGRGTHRRPETAAYILGEFGEEGCKRISFKERTNCRQASTQNPNIGLDDRPVKYRGVMSCT